MRNIDVLGVVLLVAACGGSNGNNGNGSNGSLKTFNYGTPAAPTSAQQTTATHAQTQISSVVSATSSGQAINAASAPTLADSLAASLPALVAEPEPVSVVGNGSGEHARAAARSAALSTGCYVINGNSVTYNNCSYSSAGYTATLNGTISATSNSVTWNMTETYSYVSAGYELHGNATWTGTITVTESTIVGQGRSAYHVTGAYNGTAITYDYTAAVDLNLAYAAQPFCITSGTLEIRRVLTSTSGSSTSPVRDAALKYTWSGCGNVKVAAGN